MSSAYEIVMENRKEIVERLIAQMEKGYAQTRAAWNKAHTGRPYNPVSQSVYKGGNRLRLMIAAQELGFHDPRWMTFKQASEHNCKVISGAKGILLEKWIFYKDVPKLDDEQKPVIAADGKPVIERIMYDKPIVNYFRVFNASQITGLPELERIEITENAFSQMADTFERSSMCPVRYEMQDRAYYSPAEDRIHLPPKEAFKNNEARLSVLLHEMAHSTGHETRLNRPIGNEFGSEAYAKEELNAEISSLFLEDELGISMEADSELLKDHSNYVKSWISVLKNDPNQLFVSCATAEHITEYLMDHYEKELEKVQEADKEIGGKHDMAEKALNQLTLEERYTEALRIAGYERIPVDPDELVTEVFKNAETGHVLRCDGWQLVGMELENMTVPDGDAGRFDELIHPQGRMTYYLKLPNTENISGEPEIQSFKNFDEAAKAYQNAGFVNGKTLGYLVNGGKMMDLVSYSSRSMENDLFRLSKSPTYAVDLTINELDELEKNGRQLLSNLQKENAYIQLADAISDIEMKVVSYIDRGETDELNNLAGRFVNERRPQDYFDITVDGMKEKNLILRTVHANEVVGEKMIPIKVEQIAENGVRAISHDGVADWLKENFSKLDTDYMPMGQRSFTLYATFGWNSLENHYTKLENAGYDRFPSVERRSNDMGEFVKEHSERLADLAEKGEHQSIVVNAFGGPGAGKSTACFHIVESLKKQGYVTEYVSEYAKDLVWDENHELLDGSEQHQFEILKEQLHRIDRLYGKVDFIVTDASILLNEVYNKEITPEYTEMLDKLNRQYTNFNFLVQRNSEQYETEGRIHSYQESVLKDQEVERLLEQHAVSYGVYSHETLADIVNNAIDTRMDLQLPEERISEDIVRSGFRPEKSLIKNIARFETLSERKYTVSELAQLSRQQHMFTGEKKECFEKIVAECQKQEMESSPGNTMPEGTVKQENFLKQQMQIEQMSMVQG